MRSTRPLFAALLLTTGLGLTVAAPGLAAAAPPPGPGDLAPMPAPDQPDVTVPDLDVIAPGPTPDEEPVLSIADAEEVEGDEGDGNVLAFEITSTVAPDADLSFRAWSGVIGGGATPPTDFAPLDEIVTLPAGEDSVIVEMAVVGDELVEDDELTIVWIDELTDGSADDDTAVGRILDDDVPVISIDDVTLVEGTGGPTGFHFTVSVDQAPVGDPVQVTATPAPGTADTPADWQGIPVDVVIPPGETTQDVVVSVVGDSTIEDDETFLVELTDAVDGVIGDDEGLGTILDDDAAGPGASDELTTPTTSGSRPLAASADRTHRALPVTGASFAALGLVGSGFVVTGTALAARAARARRTLS